MAIRVAVRAALDSEARTMLMHWCVRRPRLLPSEGAMASLALGT